MKDTLKYCVSELKEFMDFFSLKCKIMFCIGVVLASIAFMYRVYDANIHGDWVLAFITDSFMGFPITHILTMVAFGFWFLTFGFLYFEHRDDEIEKKNC